ncbi:hypothetical protein HanXRQr2_Chr08g0332341 [Helianthus annuus]|uniref:Uncharacterized protein n=1 Tax=Helianthus annuus TaxID=4232 RepID=A0A9K3NBZ8_HELAN|nr:hypothetical protein HanXRQr2_Chr08g0332341 [Helianthus annuus]
MMSEKGNLRNGKLDSFRKGFKVLEALDLIIRIVVEKHQIDYQLGDIKGILGLVMT